MKYSATKWPVTLVLEVADDYLDGIDKENLNDDPLGELTQLQDLADMLADTLVAAKGQILAMQEAKRKQTKEE